MTERVDSVRIPDRRARGGSDPRHGLTYDAIDRGDVVGVGSNATVYAATGPDGARLALKEPHVETPVPAEVRRRFEREGEQWHLVDDHPNVVTLHAAGTDPRPWLALERVDGGSLREHDPGPLEALWIGVQVADALAGAHDAGVAHLDVTPGNVLTRETAGEAWPVPALTDWGVGTFLEGQAANVEGLSPRYAAPEQFAPDRFGGLDARTDVSQLGVVLYELLTGKPPFTGPPASLKRAALTETPCPPTGLDPALPAGVDPVLDRALAKDPTDRYQSADEFADALAAVFADETGKEPERPNRADGTGSDDLASVPTDRGEDGHPARPYDRAITLDEQGFVQVTEQYFARREPAPLPDAWRRGLGLVDVDAGRAVARDPPSATGQDVGPVADVEADSMAEALVGTLRDGTDCAVLGSPGSGKSTVCKQVACAWVDREYGPVFYRESGGTAFDDPGSVARALARTDEDGHALVVVEDAVRPDADSVFDLLERVADSEGVSVLVDARESEWRTAGRDTATMGSDPVADGKQHLATAFVPRPDRDTHERFVEQATNAVADAPDLDADQLAAEVRRARTDAESTAEADNAAPGELFYLIHRLTALLQDPLAEETTTLTDLVREVREDLAAAGERALDVGMAVNLLNAAGIGVHPELVYAVVPDDPVAVDDAVDVLDGRVLFPRETDWNAESEPYPAVHEAWSAAYLAGGLDAAGEQAARERFGHVLTRLLAVADDPDLREGITDRLHGQAPYLERVTAAPADWVERVLDRLLEFGEQQPRLAPLFGTAETAAYDLPAACPGTARRELCKRRGDIHRKHGSLEAARAEYERSLERAQVAGDREHEASSLEDLGTVAWRRDEYDTARKYYEQSLEIRRDIGHRKGETVSLNNLGNVALRQSDVATAREYYERSLEIEREFGDRHGEAYSLHNLGIAAYREAEYDTARQYYERSLALLRGTGDRDGVVSSLTNLGIIADHQGDYATARKRYEQSLEIDRRTGHRQGEADDLLNIGDLAVQQGDHDAGQEYLEEGLAVYRDIGDRRGEGLCLQALGDLARQRGEYATARERLSESLDILRQIGHRYGEAASLRNLGGLAREQGDYDTARQHLEASLELCREVGDRDGEADSLHGLGKLARETGDDETAREYHETAVDINSEVGAVRDELAAIEDRARVAVETDHREAAIEWCERGLARVEETDLDSLDDQRATFEKLHPQK